MQEEENKVIDFIQDFKATKDEIAGAIEENADIITNIGSNPTYVSEDELDSVNKKLQDLLQQSAEKKAKLNKQIENDKEKLNNIIYISQTNPVVKYLQCHLMFMVGFDVAHCCSLNVISNGTFLTLPIDCNNSLCFTISISISL